MRKPLIVFLFACMAGVLYGQMGIVPSMKVSNLSNSESPMRLDVLNIDIKVVGQVAVTTLDMTYCNDNSRLMEGSFEFPLAEGQTITRFALDINGTLRDGVVVNKEKGRKTFEAIVRRGVDPGLVEKTLGNNFRMRVYPLPAKGSRRVLLAFEQELTDKGAYDSYVLPLKLSQPIRVFKVRAEVFKNALRVDTTGNSRSRLNFDRVHEAYIATFERTNFTPDEQIAFEFPHKQMKLSSQQEDETEVSVYTAPFHAQTDSSFFYLTLRPKAQKSAGKVMPKQLTLLWDISQSGKNRNIPMELSLLDAYIKHVGNVRIELIPFHIHALQPQIFQITDGNWGSLKTALTNQYYDGGTSLGSLDVSNCKSDEILLFSDGLTTLGNTEVVTGDKPIHTILSSSTADPDVLRYLADKTGGVAINLQKYNPEEAVDLLTHDTFRFISAKMESGYGSNIVPSLPCSFNKTMTVAGFCKGNQGSIKLNFGFGNTVTYTKTIRLESNNTMDASMLQHIWATKKINELSLRKAKNAKEIEHLAKKFGIVTDQTSLIVLENLSDYLGNDILPPAEMMSAYLHAKSTIQKGEEEQLKRRLEEVVEESNRQSAWWKTDYPIVPKIKKKPQRSSVGFNAPVVSDKAIAEDEELQSQEELSATRTTISVASVRGTDELRGVDIADLEDHKVIIEERPNSQNTVIRKTGIQLNAWDPQTPYYKVLQYAAPGEAYPTYQKLKQEYGTVPSFYLDAADFFAKAGYQDTALVVLSNLAELNLEAPQLLRALGNKLMDYKQYAMAVVVYEKLLLLRGEDPQSYRDLGLAYCADKKYQLAIETLYEVIKRNWPGRFNGIDMIVMNDINSILHTQPNLDDTFIDNRLVKKEPVDIRVCLSWDTDNCDMDLWVTDPKQEKCFYSNPRTRLGGKISNDMTAGFGPEEFMIKKAIDGKYLVQANYYGTRSQTLLAPVNLHLVFYTNFGQSNQSQQEVTLRLDAKMEVVDIGSFLFETKRSAQ